VSTFPSLILNREIGGHILIGQMATRIYLDLGFSRLALADQAAHLPGIFKCMRGR
jgi:hypothetical protein